MKHGLTALLAAILICLCAAALAGEAADVTGGCTFASASKKPDFTTMTDDNFETYYAFENKTGDALEITSQEPVRGVSVMLFDRFSQPLSYDLQVQGEDGAWRTVASGGEYLVHWHALDEDATHLRLVMTCKERLRIAEIRLYGPGDRPAAAQDWTTLDKADMMLLTAHPDDELLWFGGLLPTYAGERGYKVQMCVLAPGGGERKLELLAVAWHCGVRYYPEFFGFIDKNGGTAEAQFERWRGRDRVMSIAVRAVRRYKPDVIVSHGIYGEYGHGAHRAAAVIAQYCVQAAANPKLYTKSLAEYGAWQVRKVYLHEYTENRLTMDWSVPLAAFGGKTGDQVAEEAFEFHRSQIARNWSYRRGSSHPNTEFGLYYTSVGTDTDLNDFMEHVPQE